MIKKEDMKPGVLVWWSADRYMRSWSCPAIVTAVTEKWFRVRSLDDFKETNKLRMNDVPDFDKSPRTFEMRLCTMDEVQEYFKKQKRDLEDEVYHKKRALKDAQERLHEYKKRVESFNELV